MLDALSFKLAVLGFDGSRKNETEATTRQSGASM